MIELESSLKKQLHYKSQFLIQLSSPKHLTI